jgi:hypothetical protein
LLNIELIILFHSYTVWTVDFDTPVCKLYLLFITADAAQEKGKKVLLPTGVCLKISYGTKQRL